MLQRLLAWIIAAECVIGWWAAVVVVVDVDVDVDVADADTAVVHPFVCLSVQL